MDCARPNVVSILLSNDGDRRQFLKLIQQSNLTTLVHSLSLETFDEVLDRNGVDTWRWNSTSLLEEKGRFQYISMKRLYACRAMSTDICWPVDSESIWVRPFSLRQVTAEFASNPYIISTSRLFDRQPDDGVSNIIKYTRNLLGINEYLPWVSEEYFWVYGKQMWHAFYDAIDQRFPLPDSLPPESEG